MRRHKTESSISRYILYRYNWVDYFDQGRLYKSSTVEKFKDSKKEYLKEYSSLKEFVDKFYEDYRACNLANQDYLGVKTTKLGLTALSRLRNSIPNIDSVNNYLCNHMWKFDVSIIKLIDTYKIKLDNNL